MHKTASSLATLLILLLPFAVSAAVSVPAPPTVAATGYLLIDMDSDTVLAQQDAEQRLEPASLTKIMTAYVVFLSLIHISEPTRPELVSRMPSAA